MIRIANIKLVAKEPTSLLSEKVAKKLKISPEEVQNLIIERESIDARTTPVMKVYTLLFSTPREEKLLKRYKFLQKGQPKKYEFDFPPLQVDHSPLVIGSGPAGTFAALMLAEAGANPIILERGKMMGERDRDVDLFWQEGRLNPESNVQFGEGGAGTYSDGKLTTRVKDPRMVKVLSTFVEAGGPEEILYGNKPHIGTDLLKEVMIAIRKKIIDLGGSYRFQAKVESLFIEDQGVKGVVLATGEVIRSQHVIMAIGHSARDTFEKLYEQKVAIEAKPFAVGLRIEHPQDLIDLNQYGEASLRSYLGPAEYKLTHQSSNGRSVYSFCMCPGGYVVGASSEENRLVVNGMSEHARDGENANSALLVSVSPEDFPGNHPLRGMHFQRQLEEAAFTAGGSNYYAPTMRVSDFLGLTPVKHEVKPTYMPGTTKGDFGKIFPSYIIEALQEALPAFGQKIAGFDRGDALLTAVESRSSSPIRILRSPDNYMSPLKGLYPAGEGAGYAGGITSAAMDGIRVAEKVIAELANQES